MGKQSRSKKPENFGHTVYGAAAVIPVSGPPNPVQEHGNFSTPVTSLSTRKKRGSEAAMEASAAAKKTRSKTTSMKLTNQGCFPL
ncbi:hypothetical protein SLEP1_g17893 [Rubroshorea leprosula]|uniref:Uncharacterized protein n=1 Tax=Rubroshorea leprosula TaxID=152421 RepID=A0AAV5J4X9_9ROSI|nr:hypothetical protein SLEP1_g17893 [Rubroshorea leprosula]